MNGPTQLCMRVYVPFSSTKCCLFLVFCATFIRTLRLLRWANSHIHITTHSFFSRWFVLLNTSLRVQLNSEFQNIIIFWYFLTNNISVFQLRVEFQIISIIFSKYVCGYSTQYSSYSIQYIIRVDNFVMHHECILTYMHACMHQVWSAGVCNWVLIYGWSTPTCIHTRIHIHTYTLSSI